MESNIPPVMRQRTDHHDAHQSFTYMEAVGHLLPGEQKKFWYLQRDKKPSQSQFVKTDTDDYVFDAVHQNCVLAGERVPVLFNLEMHRLEIAGSHGLVRAIRLDADIADNASGAAYILDRTGQDATLITLYNETGAALSDDDVVTGQYYYSSTAARWVCQSSGGGAATLLIPVTLTKTGGDQGTATTAASFEYTIKDAVTTTTLGTSQDIGAGVHKYLRPKGAIVEGTFGIVWVDLAIPASPVYRVVYANEQPAFALETPAP